MYAVIKSGGKQHRVSEGEEILLEKISLDEGEIVEFSEVWIDILVFKPFPKKLDTGEIDEQGKPIYTYQQQYTAPKYSRVWNISQTDLVDKELDTSIPVIQEVLTDAETLAKNYLINTFSYCFKNSTSYPATLKMNRVKNVFHH